MYYGDVFGPMFGTFAALVACLAIVIGMSLTILIIFAFVACVLDVLSKDETTFRDRNLWIVLFIISFFTGFLWLATIVYYLLYKPRLDFWNR